MKKNTIGVTIEHFSFIDWMGIKIIDWFPQAILGNLNYWICDLRTRHSAGKGCTSVSEHHIHKQLQSILSFLEDIFDTLLTVEFGWIFYHYSGNQKLQQNFRNESFFHVLFHKSYFVGCDEDVVSQIFYHLFLVCLVLDQLADFLHVHRHTTAYSQFLSLSLFEKLFDRT